MNETALNTGLDCQAITDLLMHHFALQPDCAWKAQSFGSGMCSKRSHTWQPNRPQSWSMTSSSTLTAVSWYRRVIVPRLIPVSRVTSEIFSFLSPIRRERWHLTTESSSEKKWSTEDQKNLQKGKIPLILIRSGSNYLLKALICPAKDYHRPEKKSMEHDQASPVD